MGFFYWFYWYILLTHLSHLHIESGARDLHPKQTTMTTIFFFSFKIDGFKSKMNKMCFFTDLARPIYWPTFIYIVSLVLEICILNKHNNDTIFF